MLELKLLGKPDLTWRGEPAPLPSPKILGLLAYLALQNEAKTRQELLELFWDAGKASNLRFALHKLRDLPGSGDWLATADSFVKANVATDVRRFEDALSQGRFADALDIWHGDEEGDKPLLKGVELGDAGHFTSWLELERSRLEQLYLTALQKGIEELEQGGKLEDALQLAHALLVKDRLNETAHRAVMRLEHRRGDTEAALAQFEACRQVLKDELGVEPLEDTLELLRELERGGVSSGKNALLASTGAEVPARPDKLIGRAGLISDTLAALKVQGRVLLHGFGGAGKTALAATVAKTQLDGGGGSVLWLQVGDDAPDVLFGALARAFDAQQQLSQAKETEKTNTLKTLLAKQKISLFVLDDVWNAYALSKVMEAVPETIPLLVTSRQRYPNIKRLDVGRLAREDGLELLSHHAKTDLSTDANADKLCETLGDHAFALRIAGINLAADGQTPAQLLGHITDAPHRMKTPPDFAEAGRESVAALLTASLNALPEDAYEAFMGFGVLFSTSSTPELLSLCTRRGINETEEALFTLQKRGLAGRATEPGSDVVTYRVHDLAYSFARANSHFRLKTVQGACHSFVTAHRETFDVLDADITNLLGAAQSALETENDSLVLDIMRSLVVGDKAYYASRGHSQASLGLLKAAIRVAKDRADLDSAHYLIARLGDSYREFSGDLDRALAAFQEALALARALNNPGREIVMLSLIGTTRSYQNEDDAEAYLTEAYELAQTHGDSLALCHSLINLGCLTCAKGAFGRSRAFFTEALQTSEKLAGVQHNRERVRFFTLLNLGEVEHKLGRVSDAVAHRQKALALAQARDNRVWMAYAHHELGETYHGAGERTLAQRHCQQALVLYEQNRARAAVETLSTFMKEAGYPLTSALSAA